MNLTDVDDKTIRGSREEGISLGQYTQRYKKAFFEDIQKLNIERAEFYPEATQHIQDMVDLIKKLIEKGYAYEAGGSIYYRISRFASYGRLSGMKVEDLKPGIRVDSDEYGKESARDFALWKAWTLDDGDVYWETELGKGRPGWHIECSAMSMKYLGSQFDIHTGGVDNIFPHHENEIAQSEGATGGKFANYWMHCEFLLANGHKMSKSLGNQYTLRDILNRGYDPMSVRYAQMATHYRQPLNFTFRALEASQEAVHRFNDFIFNLGEVVQGENNPQVKKDLRETEASFIHAMDDDLNTPQALATLFNYVKRVNILMAGDRLSQKDAEKILNTFKRLNDVLGIMNFQKESINEEVHELVTEREKARQRKEWGLADKIREKLEKRGIILKDTKRGTILKKKKI